MRPGQPLHDEVKKRLSGYIDLARRHAQDRWSALDVCDALYRNYADPEEVDDEGRKKNPYPRSTVVGFSYAAIQTLVSYWFNSFTSQASLIPVYAPDPADDRAAEAAEAVLHEKLMLDGFEVMLWQWLLDAARYGQGRVHSTWQTEHEQVVERSMVYTASLFGMQGPGRMVERTGWRTASEGPATWVIPPRQYLPDPRVSTADPQRGEFVAYESWLSWHQLKSRQREAEYFNLEQVTQRKSSWVGTPTAPYTTAPTDYAISHEYATEDDKGYLKIEALYVRLVPSEWKGGGQALGSGTEPEIWLLALANDDTVIQARPFDGSAFPIGVMDANLDLHALWNPSDIEVVQGISEHVNWLYNARQANLRMGIYHAIAYDEDAVEAEDIYTIEPGIRIRLKNLQGRPLSQVLTQLPWHDVTANFVGDIEGGGNLIKLILGAPDVMQGMAMGRATSATEVSILMKQAQGRAGARGRLMWLQGVMPWARMLLREMQTHLTEEKFVRIVGDAARHWGEMLQQGRALVGPGMIQGELRVQPGDFSAPMDRDGMAQKWMQAAMTVAKDATLSQRYDWVEMFQRAAELSGMRNIEDFVLHTPAAPVQVMPDEQVLDQAERGNLAPVAGDGGPEAAVMQQILQGIGARG